jgi:hypothetical protein
LGIRNKESFSFVPITSALVCFRRNILTKGKRRKKKGGKTMKEFPCRTDKELKDFGLYPRGAETEREDLHHL